MKVLVLAVPIGAGHMKAARAISQALRECDRSVEVRFENCFLWVWPWYGCLYSRIYDYAQKKARGLLKKLYGGAGVTHGSSPLLYRTHRVLAHRFRYLIEEYRPDYILCTHFSPGYFAALYKRQYGYKIGIVVTDYYIHPHWVNQEIDHYFIPHEFLTPQIIDYGAEKTQVYPFGIPVALELEDEIDLRAVRKRFDLTSDRISVTVMGSRVFGGEWFGVVREIVDFDYDLRVLCGDNREVMERIKQLKGKARLSLYGMVERIHELIAATDILVTKAGGITTTEASKAGPCLLFANSIVGLEDKNEDFFIQHGAALRITIENAKHVMKELLSSPPRIASMRGNLKKLGKKGSASNIARVITHGAGEV